MQIPSLETADEPPPVVKRLSAPERRASFIDAASRLFAEKGFHGVSVDEIVRVVGVSPAVLYRHFASKEALYQAVLDELSCQREDYVAAVVKSDMVFANVLREMTHVFMRSFIRQPNLLKMEMHSQLEGNPATQEFFKNRWKTFTDYIEFGLGELQNAKEIPPIDTRAAGLMYQGMLREVLLTKCLQATDRFDDVELEPLVDQLLDLFLKTVYCAEVA